MGIRRLEFAYQEGNAGIADALKLAREFTAPRRRAWVLGDNIIGGSISGAMGRFARQARGRVRS